MKLSILIVILSVFWAAIFFALFNDKPLIPEVNEILEVSPNHVPDDENAYLAILGMQYETDIEPHVIGRQLVSRYQTFVHKKANEIESLQQNIDYPVRSLSFNVQDNSNFCFSKKIVTVERYAVGLKT